MPLDTTGLPDNLAGIAQAIYLVDQPKGQAFVTAYLNRQVLAARGQAALATNATYLGLPDPTAANTAYRNAAALVASPTLVQLTSYVRLMEAQIKALSQQNNALVAESIALAKQNNALIRLALNLLDDVSNT